MGINSNCYLPIDTRAEDVVTAIAYLCGATRVKGEISGGSFYAGVNRDEVSTKPNEEAKFVFVRSTHDMQYFTVEIAPTTCDRERHSGSLFLYPKSERPNRICVYAGVSPFWNKIGRALVDMFGGEVDDNDCDGSDVDYKKKKPRKSNCPNDGKPWRDFQDDMLNLPKLFDFLSPADE